MSRAASAVGRSGMMRAAIMSLGKPMISVRYCSTPRAMPSGSTRTAPSLVMEMVRIDEGAVEVEEDDAGHGRVLRLG